MKLVDDKGNEIEIERAQVVDIQPHDVIVITLPEYAGDEDAAITHNFFGLMFPGRKVTVLAHGVEMRVMREGIPTV